jgi:hypothetical protein
MTLFEAGEAVYGYARPDKSWLKDPSGIAWEAHRTVLNAELFSSSKTENTKLCCESKSCRLAST